MNGEEAAPAKPLADRENGWHSQLARRAVHGAAWVYLSYAAGKLTVFLTTALLARLLAVEDFGLAGYALVVINYLDIIKDLGISSALIAYPDRRDSLGARSTAFLLTVLAGATLTGSAILAAPLVGLFFQEPSAVDLTRLMALTLFISCLGRTHDALLQRELSFRAKLAPDLAQSLVKSAVSLSLALHGGGAWSLAWGQVAGAAASTVMSWVVYRWLPCLSFDRQAAKHLLRYGLQLVGFALLTAALLNMDYLLIGRVLGATALGLYTIAFRLPDLALVNLCWVLSRVLFPVFARLQDDREALRRAYLSTVRFVALAVVPLGLGLVVTAPSVILTLFGEKWLPAVRTMQLLAVFSTIHALHFHTGDVFKVTGRIGLLVRFNLIAGAVTLPLMMAGLLHLGTEGVALAWIVGELIGLTLNVRALRRELGIRPGTYAACLRLPLVAGAGLCASAWLAGRVVPEPSVLQLAAQVSAGGLTYAAIAAWRDPATVGSLLRLVGFPLHRRLLDRQDRAG